jgi:MCP family monocarboxylic acid transporter-like MFS transporter 14
MPQFSSYQAFVVLAVSFGFTVSAYIALHTIVVVQLFGLENLTEACGYIYLYIGIALTVGPPFAGFLFDQTKTYHIPFYVSGVLLGSASIFSCIAFCRQKKNQRKVKSEVNGFTNTTSSEINL